jgi:hypothetical protein
MSHIFNRNKFFEDLNARIDKPIDYNHMITQIIAEILDQMEEQEIFFVEGVGYHYDPVRQTYLSVDRNYTVAGGYGLKVKDRYLKIAEVPTAGEQGIRMPRAGTITGLSVKSRSTADYYIEIRRNGVPLTLVSMLVENGGTHNNAINIDFSEGDHLQIYLDGEAEHPIAQLECAWRVETGPI